MKALMELSKQMPRSSMTDDVVLSESIYRGGEGGSHLVKINKKNGARRLLVNLKTNDVPFSKRALVKQNCNVPCPYKREKALNI